MTDRDQVLALIDDYVSGRMNDAERELFEERLFALEDEVQAEVAFLDRLARFTHHIVARGLLHPSLMREELDQLVVGGTRVDLRELGAPGVVTVQPLEEGAQVVVQRADLRLFDVTNVDLEIVLPELGHVKTLRDLAVDPNDGAVYACCDAVLFRMAMAESPRTTFRVVALRGGRRETIGEYELVAPG